VIVSGTYQCDDDDDGGNTNNNANGDSDTEDDKQSPPEAKPEIVDKNRQPPRPPTCPLFLVVYGDKGKTSDLPLISEGKDEKELFQPGSEDEFEVGKCFGFVTLKYM